MSDLPPSQPPPPYSYNPPPGSAPTPPQKSSRTWLYVILGLLGVCLLCGVAAAVIFAVGMPIISRVSNQVEFSDHTIRDGNAFNPGNSGCSNGRSPEGYNGPRGTGRYDGTIRPNYGVQSE